MTHETSNLILSLIESCPQLGANVLTQAPIDMSADDAVEQFAARKSALDDLLGKTPQ